MTRFRLFVPRLPGAHFGDRALAAIGAVIGVLCAAMAGFAVQHGFSELPFLIAPMGASAVLVFAVPASPLAQPWAVMGGNLLSALVGLVAAALIGWPPLAVAVAVGAAIAVMSVARCLHPPGGACAVLAALGSPAVAAHGWGAFLGPLALNVIALIAAGYLWNNLTGHRWPHRMPAQPVPGPRGYDRADLDAVLEEWDEVLDVSPDDLDALFRAVERRAVQRGAG